MEGDNMRRGKKWKQLTAFILVALVIANTIPSKELRSIQVVSEKLDPTIENVVDNSEIVQDDAGKVNFTNSKFIDGITNNYSDENVSVDEMVYQETPDIIFDNVSEEGDDAEEIIATKENEDGEGGMFHCDEQNEIAPDLVSNYISMYGNLGTKLEVEENMESQKLTRKVLNSSSFPGYDGKPSEVKGLSGICCPSMGDIRALVVRVEFSDVKFAETHTEDYFREMMFGDEDTGSEFYPCESLAAWYKRSSFGKLSIDGDVISIALPQTKDFYTEADAGEDGQAWLGSEKVIQFGEDVCAALKNSSIEWENYDSNNDHIVDAPIFIIAGDAGPWASQWWSHVRTGNYGDIDDEKVYEFCKYGECMESHMQSATTTIHEFGHMLGLPDLYNTSSHIFNQITTGLSTADMMCYNSGDFNAFSKMLLGWIAPEEISVVTKDTKDQIIFLNGYTDAGSCAVIMLDDKGLLGEYFLIQYEDYKNNDDVFNIVNKKENFLRIYHVNAETSNGSFIHDNVTAQGDENADCRLIEIVDKDAEWKHESIKYSITSRSLDVYLGIASRDITWNGDGLFDCFYKSGDTLTPYTVPSSGKYSEDRKQSSMLQYTGLYLDSIAFENEKASFRVYYEAEKDPDCEPLDLHLSSHGDNSDDSFNYELCDTDSFNAAFVGNHEFWVYDNSLVPFLREKGSSESGVPLQYDTKKIWVNLQAETPFCHAGIKVSTSVNLKPKTRYEVVFPAGMFVTSYGDISGEIIREIRTRNKSIYENAEEINYQWTENDVFTSNNIYLEGEDVWIAKTGNQEGITICNLDRLTGKTKDEFVIDDSGTIDASNGGLRGFGKVGDLWYIFTVEPNGGGVEYKLQILDENQELVADKTQSIIGDYNLRARALDDNRLLIYGYAGNPELVYDVRRNKQILMSRNDLYGYQKMVPTDDNFIMTNARYLSYGYNKIVPFELVDQNFERIKALDYDETLKIVTFVKNEDRRYLIGNKDENITLCEIDSNYNLVSERVLVEKDSVIESYDAIKKLKDGWVLYGSKSRLTYYFDKDFHLDDVDYEGSSTDYLVEQDGESVLVSVSGTVNSIFFKSSTPIAIKQYDHKISNTAIPRKEPTCASFGWKEHYECELCHKPFIKNENGEFEEAIDVIIDKNDHIWNDGVLVASPTVEYTCTLCGKTEKRMRAQIDNAPKGKKMSYRGVEQNLVTAGTASWGTLQYALGDDDTDIPAETDFSDKIPDWMLGFIMSGTKSKGMRIMRTRLLHVCKQVFQRLKLFSM